MTEDLNKMQHFYSVWGEIWQKVPWFRAFCHKKYTIIEKMFHKIEIFK